MRKIFLITILCLFVGLSGLTAQADTSDFVIQWFSVDNGGVLESSGGSFSLNGTIGQPDAGVISGGDYTLQGGFWNSDTANALLEIFMPVVVK